MLKRNLIQIFRSYLRFKSTFFINLIGLSTGLACSLLIYLWVSNELSFDQFHENGSRLFQVMERQHATGSILTKYRTSGPVAETLEDLMPEVEYATAVISSSWFPKFVLSATADDKVKAVGQFASKDYFNVFSFDLIEGKKDDVLADKNLIVISDELALKLFNTTQNVVGKVIELQLTDIKKELTISGVFKRVPPNSSEDFDFVVPFDWFKDISPAVSSWGNDGTNTYIVTKQGADIDMLNKKIADLIKRKIPGSERTLFLKPYSDIYLYGNYKNGVQSGGRIEYVRLFSIVALIILIIACINFMNLSTAKASRRIKEVGIKKAIGASRTTLILYYMGESMLMAFMSLGLALVMVQFVLPQFNTLTGKHLGLTPDIQLLLPLIGITLFTGVVSGCYPALYLSGFNPAAVLKGKFHASMGELWARKGLVVFQFTLSVIMIVAVVVVYKQISFIQSKNLGYNKDNIIYFEKEGKLTGNVETFLNKVKDIPEVKAASAMWGNIVGGYSTTGDIVWQGKDPANATDFEIMGVDYDLLEMLDIKMAAGRSFSRDFVTDTSKIIFNEAAIDAMGLQDPVGKVVQLWGQDMEIIGVVRNFHFQSLHENVKPLFIRLQPENTSVIMTKVAAGEEEKAIEALRQLYKTFNPGFTFDYRFLDEDYQMQYAAEKRVSVLSRYFAALAILISCLGLFGLAAFTAERRIKEIGIRKVLGCSEWGIIYLMSRDFTRMILLSILLALPVSYFAARYWLSEFAYKIELHLWFFAGAGLAALIITWFTVGSQAIKAARINPVKNLRSE